MLVWSFSGFDPVVIWREQSRSEREREREIAIAS